MSSDTDRPLRRDAQRSRELVLAAARRLFAERGLDVGFDEIARHAGVGVGTVYRRFPDRAAMIDALFAERIAELVGVAEAHESIADPWEAMVSFCHASVRAQQQDRGLLQVLVAGSSMGDHLTDLRMRAAATVQRLLDRAQEAGIVRRDLEALDVVLALHLLGRLSLPDGTEMWQRGLEIFLDGIRLRPDQAPLPGPAFTFDTFLGVARGV